MKVAVSAISGSLDAQIDPRFGRCQYFVIVETETMSLEVLPNPGQGASSGAGIQAGQTMAKQGVQAVLTGNVGPNAFQVLSQAGIRILTGVSGTVREAVERFKSGQLQETTAPTSPMHFGTGGGVGMGGGGGRGMGMGRGGGRGGGCGMGMRRWQTMPPYAQQPPGGLPVMPTAPPQMSREQEVSMLEDQMKSLQKQLDQTRRRLEGLRNNEQKDG